MCFSASASFGASAILLVGGIVAMKKIQAPSQALFASIPILFSIQQFIEGLVWLSLTNINYAVWQQPATYIYLTFAHVFWPTWFPFSVFLLEENEKRKKVLKVLVGLGCIGSLYLAFSLFLYDAGSTISSHHIRYDLYFPRFILLLNSVFYFLPIALPAFISSVKKMNFIGALLLISFLLTEIYFREYLVSVWCFFAATISLIIVLIVMDFVPSLKKSSRLVA